MMQVVKRGKRYTARARVPVQSEGSVPGAFVQKDRPDYKSQTRRLSL